MKRLGFILILISATSVASIIVFWDKIKKIFFDTNTQPIITASQPTYFFTGNNSDTTVNNYLTATLGTKFVANGNNEKFVVPVVALIAHPIQYIFKISTDISSQPSIIYNILGLQKDNELVIEVSNYSGVDINTIPITISYMKIN